MKATTSVKDPVCGMEIEPASAAGHTERKSQTYYFCSAKCMEKFEAKPEQYLGKSAPAQKSASCCCG